MARSTGASRAMATMRVVANACASSADAGTTSTPPGHTARIARRSSLGLELIARHELGDVVHVPKLVRPVLVVAVLGLLCLYVRLCLVRRRRHAHEDVKKIALLGR